jgi:bifunctional non-homologous end joining protein LigD
MPLRPPALPPGFIAPCLPTSAPQPPSGDMWLHEIKHDGFRVIARKGGKQVKLYSRPGNDLTKRFPLIVDAIARLYSRSCIIDERRWRVVMTGSRPSIASGTGNMTRTCFSMSST